MDALLTWGINRRSARSGLSTDLWVEIVHQLLSEGRTRGEVILGLSVLDIPCESKP